MKPAKMQALISETIMTLKNLALSIIRTFTLSALVLTSGLAIAGGHSTKTIKSADTEVGTVLTNAAGLTLYTFDKDEPNTSNCYDQCAINWPPMPAKASSENEGNLTVVKRNDGTFQWAQNGQPLYTWIGDTEQGDTTGNGVGGVWHVAKK
jgi:predicted lipoprotein with Yx(FWY)xxD motif